MTPDMINGLFELFGSVMLWTNVRQLRKDKELKGINWWTVVFFTSWGIWNLFYYPSLGQWWSFAGGISIALANVVWLVLLVKYKFDKWNTFKLPPGRGNALMPKFIFTYDPDKDGAALLDGQVRGYADMLVSAAIAADKIDVVVSNGLVMNLIRLAVVQGKLPYEETVYKYKEETLLLSRNGSPLNWPNGFCDLGLDIVTELLTEQGKLSEERKAAKKWQSK